MLYLPLYSLGTRVPQGIETWFCRRPEASCLQHPEPCPQSMETRWRALRLRHWSCPHTLRESCPTGQADRDSPGTQLSLSFIEVHLMQRQNAAITARRMCCHLSFHNSLHDSHAYLLLDWLLGSLYLCCCCKCYFFYNHTLKNLFFLFLFVGSLWDSGR